MAWKSQKLVDIQYISDNNPEESFEDLKKIILEKKKYKMT